MALSKREFNSLKPKTKSYSVADGGGLNVKVQPDGRKILFLMYRINGRQRKLTFGEIPLADARSQALAAKAKIAQGIDPQEAAREAKLQKVTLGDFIEGRFSDWARTHQQAPQSTLAMLKDQFGHLYQRPLNALSYDDFDHWRNNARLKSGAKPKAESLNRYTTAIRKVFSYARDLGLIAEHPLATFKKLKSDQNYTPRWLNAAEEKALFGAICERDVERRSAEVTNWITLSDRIEELAEMGDLDELKNTTLNLLSDPPSLVCDYLHPLATITLAAGLRRREALNLRWSDISQEDASAGAVLTIKASNAKSRRERYIPINPMTLLQLQSWRKHSLAGKELMFPNPVILKKFGVERAMSDIDTSWENVVKRAAKVEPSIAGIGIRALRATFGSKLVQAGVSIFQVSELMGHADVDVTKRHYAVLTLDDAKKAIRTVDPFAALQEGLTKAPDASNILAFQKRAS